MASRPGIEATPGRPLIGALLRRPTRAVVLAIDEGFKDAGFRDLRPEYFGVFINVDHERGSRITELAEAGHVTKQTMGHLVDYLRERGYVKTVPDPTDARAKLVRLTRKGWRVHDLADEIVTDLEARWSSMLGDDRFVVLVELLADLGRGLDSGA